MTREINWGRLQREAVEAYREEARRRQRAGELATADAEELAAALVRRQLSGVDAADELTDQSVYVYNGSVMLAHLFPSSRWSQEVTDQGMALRTMLFSPTLKRYVDGPYFKAGEWTYCGRGQPGV